MKRLTILFVILGLFFVGCEKGIENPHGPEIPPIEKVLPTIEYFRTDFETIYRGIGLAILSWKTKDATKVTIDNGIGEVDSEGSVEVTPNNTTTYVLCANNEWGQVTESCTVKVVLPPKAVIEYFIATPETIDGGQCSVLSWLVTNATEVEINHGIGMVNFESSIEVCPVVSLVYRLTARIRDRDNHVMFYITKDCEVWVAYD